MFTGIIEAVGEVTKTEVQGSNRVFWIRSRLSAELKIDQSLSHNGACLTIEEIQGTEHRVTAVQETLEKTDLGDWQVGDRVNLERCLMLNGRLDGHMVQGHVDTVGYLIEKKDMQGSWQFSFRFPSEFSTLMIEKGSITVNGISLTAFNISDQGFTVAIIPYTYEHTNLSDLQANDKVNLEFDMIGKYINRYLKIQNG
jgi:riboflavin synthase